MRTLLICHKGAELHEDGIARWLAAESELCGIVLLDEPPKATWRRAKREIKRSGWLGFVNVMAFRLYYRLRLAAPDATWLAGRLTKLQQWYPAVPASVPVLRVPSPNNDRTKEFIEQCQPDVTVALCKVILKPYIFTIPTDGTFVFHPGICPEYRNAHGCFWALAQRDLERVGMTLLRIDEGVDTGPVYGFFSYPYDEIQESHIIIQNRVVLDNLDGLMAKLRDVHTKHAEQIDTTGRASAVWGQPKLTNYLRWKRAAKRRARNNA